MQMDDEDLDISWIQSHEKILSIHENYKREPMESISLYFLYINQNEEIEKIIREKEGLEGRDDFQRLSKERILQIVQQKKKTNTGKYSLDHILVYNITIEPENIQKYVNTDNLVEFSQPFIKNLSVIDEIKIYPSIFVFHSLNSIFFFFKKMDEPNVPPFVRKSILKIGNVIDENKNKKTKKVRIMEEPDERPLKKNKHNVNKHNVTKKLFAP